MQKKKKTKDKKKKKNYPVIEFPVGLLTQVPVAYGCNNIPEIKPMILKEKQYEKTIAQINEALTTSQKQITNLIGMLAKGKKF